MGINPAQLFSSAVAQYARYRTGYPPAEVAALAELLRLDHTRTVVDIGCGTGQLAIPLAQHARAVTAIDPVPEMLAVGRRTAHAQGLTNIHWLLGDSENLAEVLSPGTDIATFAASFHWTRRAEVVQVLDRLLLPCGSIVTINDDLPETEQPDWDKAVDDLRAAYLGADHTAATDPYTDAPLSHRAVFESSSFSSVQSVIWEWDRRLTIDEAVGLQFTYSFSTPALFGSRAREFATEARATILAMHPAGWVTEPFRMEVLIARRPQPFPQLRNRDLQ